MDSLDTTNQLVCTAGELLETAAVEQLRGGQMLLSTDGRLDIGPAVEHSNITYTPVPLDVAFERALQLPAGVGNLGSLEETVAELMGLIGSRCGLDQNAALVVTTMVLGTWVHEALPSRLCVNLWGAAATRLPLRQFLGAVCRRPLSLTSPSWGEIARLPICPTLVLDETAPRELMSALTTFGPVQLLRRGRFVELDCPSVVTTASPLPGAILRVPLGLAEENVAPLTTHEVEQLAAKWQPTLLAYRLAHHSAVAKSAFDEPSFSIETRNMARALGAALAGAPRLQAELAKAITGADQEQRTERLLTSTSALLQVLIVLCHENKPSALVGEITKLTNALLSAQEMSAGLKSRAIGQSLRAEFGLKPQRRTDGYTLTLDRDVRTRVHRLAAAGGELSFLRAVDCEICGQLMPVGPVSDLEAMPGVTDPLVQDVHHVQSIPEKEDIHDVQDVHATPESSTEEQAPKPLPQSDRADGALIEEYLSTKEVS